MKIMNELQKIRDYIVGKFQSDPLVNTITTLKPDLIDTNKATIYPVVNINYTSSEGIDDVIQFAYDIKALDQLDVYNRSTDNKLQSDTNEQDVFNETFNICQSFINSFRQYNADGIELISVTNIKPIKNENLNGLSGHAFTIILSIPNEGSSCLTE